ncbi:hypothetical protein VTN00DRAFT_2828 [Thermoascus crustaceus]|uniref:uncharacterized protein n=1 Tax=Thermoascus crustaceus TaxID=5088 RepID=UPI00374455F2
MSFLSSVLSSIETGKPASLPPPTPAAPRSPAPGSSGAAGKSEGSKDAPARGSNPAGAGVKRKAEEQLRRPDKPDGPAPSKSTPSKPMPSASAATKPRPASVPATSGAKTAAKPSTSSGASSAPKTPPAAAPSKPPPKGSFADLMLKAKEVQQKAPTQVGMLKHQAVPKEKLSKAERKKRALEAMAKEKEARQGKKVGTASGASAGVKAGGKPGEGGPVKRREPEENTYKGTARPTQPLPTYKGTAGLPPRRQPNDLQKRAPARYGRPARRDEYLGTDEEDEGDYYNDYDDYYSDESSDMEAGLEDVEQEEEAALRAAKKEDEEDIRAEMAAKREKLERKKKLAALAKSKR